MFPDALVGRGTFFHYDTWMQNLAFRAWWFGELRHGHFATWCPGLFAGYPLFAETQTGPLYPPTFLLFSLLPPTLAFSWSVLLHFALAGTGTYLAARRFGVGWGGALYAGVVFELSGFLVTHVVHFNLLVGAAWTPWVALLALGTAERRRGSMLGLAAVFAALLLGSHPYATLMNGGLAVAVVLARCGARPRALAVGAGTLVGVGIVAIAVAAVQLLPARELLARTPRGSGVDWSFLTFGSFPPWNVFTLAAPDLVGTPVNDTYWGGPDWSHFAETCAYVGLLTIALAVVALVLRRDRATALFAVVAAGSGLLMLGRYTPVYRIVAALPVLESTRLPARFALPATFAVAMLAGLGLDALPRATRRLRRAALGAAVLVVLVLAAGAWRAGTEARHPDAELMTTGRAWPARMERIHEAADAGAIRLAIVALGTLVLLGAGLGRARVRTAPAVLVATLWTVGELFTWGRSFNPRIDPAAVMRPPPVVEALRDERPSGGPRPRVFRQGVAEEWSRREGMARVDLMTPGWKGREEGYRTGAWTLPPNTQLLYGVDSGEGFTSLPPLAWLEWMGLGTRPGATPHPDLTEAQADLLSIDAVISTGSGIRGKGWEAARLPGDVWWSRNTDPLPRVRRARSWRTMPDRTALLDTLRTPDHDPRRAVLLESPPGGLPPFRAGGPVDEPLAARETTSGRWEIDVPPGDSALVVLSESYDPGWIAEDDSGSRRPVFRADGLFAAFVAPPGGGTIVLRYAPDSLRQGAVVSIVGLVLLVALVSRLRNVMRLDRSVMQLPTSRSVTLVTLLVVSSCIAFSAIGDIGGWRSDRADATLEAAAVRAWTGEAEGAFLAGALAPAESLLQTAARRTPHDASLHYRLGLVQRKAGRTAAAIASFERALSEDPDFEPARIAIRDMEPTVP